jgi:hypothetical protein
LLYFRLHGEWIEDLRNRKLKKEEESGENSKSQSPTIEQLQSEAKGQPQGQAEAKTEEGAVEKEVVAEQESTPNTVDNKGDDYNSTLQSVSSERLSDGKANPTVTDRVFYEINDSQATEPQLIDVEDNITSQSRPKSQAEADQPSEDTTAKRNREKSKSKSKDNDKSNKVVEVEEGKEDITIEKDDSKDRKRRKTNNDNPTVSTKPAESSPKRLWQSEEQIVGCNNKKEKSSSKRKHKDGTSGENEVGKTSKDYESSYDEEEITSKPSRKKHKQSSPTSTNTSGDSAEKAKRSRGKGDDKKQANKFHTEETDIGEYFDEPITVVRSSRSKAMSLTEVLRGRR